MFLGYRSEFEKLYAYLQTSGYELVFKEVAQDAYGKVKGNVDVDLTLHTLLQLENYDSALLITSDGDFAPLAEFLLSRNKLSRVISPERKTCSWLLRKYAQHRVDYLSNVKSKLKKHP